MKKMISLSMISALSLSSLSVSAATIMASDSHMMDSHSSMMMTTDTMMKSDTMMMKKTPASTMKATPMVAEVKYVMKDKSKISIEKKGVARVAMELGYNWRNDRHMLAEMAGIQNYRGSVSQNLALKAYLLSAYKQGVMVGGASMIQMQDIVENAVRANNVTTVVAAVQAAGLVDTLKSAGPFTVFAPDNAAFEKLPAGTVETLLKPENKAMLANILTYHVVSGKYTSADITDGMVLTTVQGKTLTFKKDASGSVWINGAAMVETADVISTNGVTHVIDSVLLPPQ